MKAKDIDELYRSGKELIFHFGIRGLPTATIGGQRITLKQGGKLESKYKTISKLVMVHAGLTKHIYTIIKPNV